MGGWHDGIYSDRIRQLACWYRVGYDHNHISSTLLTVTLYWFTANVMQDASTDLSLRVCFCLTA